MSGGGVGRRFVNIGVLDGRKRLYSLRRLALSKVDLFYRTAEDAAARAKVVPTLTPAKAMAPDRRRSCKIDLATAETAAPKIDPPAAVVAARPPVCSSFLPTHHAVHFFPTASENKVILADRANRMFRFDTDDGCRCIDSMPSLHAPKHTPLAISVPPTTLQLHDGEDTGELYIIDSVLKPDKAQPQFEALVWREPDPSFVTGRSWQCDILPLPPFIAHHKHAFVFSHAVIGGDTICFSIAGAEGAGTYCFHTATREWSKAGDWLMPFHGKEEYVPELGFWFGVLRGLPCAIDLSGVVRGEEPPPEKMRIWVDDDLPKEWQPSVLCKSKVISLGFGRFFVADFFDNMVFDKDNNEMVSAKQFAVFTGMEVVYGNGKGKGKGKGNGKCNGNGNNGTGSNGNYNNGNDGKDNDGNNGTSSNGSNGKGKGGMRGLRMMKHKSSRYMFHLKNMIEAVL